MTVARTANDLIRYHNKVMVIDSRILAVLSFNFTRWISTAAGDLEL